MAVYNIGGYYEPLYKMLEATADGGFMTHECLNLFKFTDDENALIEYLEKGDGDFGGVKFKKI